MSEKKFEIEWGSLALIEFIVSESDNIGAKYKTCIDIGSGAGIHTQIMREAGLEVYELDKYAENAEYQVDLLEHEFDRKFDVIFCSHVIEHQRNVGLFLDKIYDILNDDGLLIISAPKHPAEWMIEGHLNCFSTSYFLQHLIYAGFDCKKGKFLSCKGIENSAIVPKADNFDFSERGEAGYKWTENLQARSFLDLKHQNVQNDLLFFYNCTIFSSPDQQSMSVNIPTTYKPKGFTVNVPRWGFTVPL